MDAPEDCTMDGTLADKSLVRLSAAECDDAVRHARQMFNRVLASWAIDLLALRREGRMTPRWQLNDDIDESMRQAA
jgi:hypothetical protein